MDPEQQVGIIIPLYNEQDAVEAFHQQLCAVIDPLPQHFTLYFVDDGSTDATAERLIVIAEEDERVIVVELSRNFGHQAALTAGLDLAREDYVITMDGDGQHPPEHIPEMLALADNGYDMVLTQRMDGEDSALSFKGSTSNLFYKLINRIGDTHILPGGADFRLMNANVVDALCEMKETHRFLRGMVGWMGYRTVILPYSPPERLAGKTKYSLRKMVRLSLNAIFSFSLLPLYLIVALGGTFLVLAAAEVIYVLSLWFLNPEQLAPGWSSLMFMLLVVGGTLMVSVGLIGIYIGYIFQEVKGRPVYLVRRVFGREDEEG